MTFPRRPLLLALPCVSLLLNGCAPTVNVAVPKPVVIDVNMKVDVTSRNEAPKPAADATKDKTGGAAEDAHNLSSEVQSLKETHFIGEAATGYVAIRDLPAGNAAAGKVNTGENYGDYIKRIVDEENRARRTIYGTQASTQGTTLDVEARAAGKRLFSQANSGEWLQDENGKWTQK
ncbi:YnbE-like lipoprotein [Verrucomicrobium sp. GAS474]|uniref:DUF1318 domain-containing protein n=1 Tax=Verrucomicrobium sp. GAS474 TaxID=1882831 RepID=UPI00087BE10B|nr:DUF1318 domain-containing protein [Verrucomicrobium sp. GAS474]SDU00449.1 YnbE-like lipoprotein [Verrucomicrobium sp. GAS474]